MPPVPSERTTAPTVRQMSSEHAPILRPCVGHGKKGYPTREPVTRRSPRGNLKRVTVCGESHINGFLDTGSIPVGSTKIQGHPIFGVPLYFSDQMEGIERVRSERPHSALSERTLTERAVRARAFPVGRDRTNHPISGCPCIFLIEWRESNGCGVKDSTV